MEDLNRSSRVRLFSLWARAVILVAWVAAIVLVPEGQHCSTTTLTDKVSLIFFMFLVGIMGWDLAQHRRDKKEDDTLLRMWQDEAKEQ